MKKIIKASASTPTGTHLHVEILHLQRQREATMDWLSSAAQSTLRRCWQQRSPGADECKR